MDVMRRAACGALGGLGATVALTGLRQALKLSGLVQESAPEQVVARLEELGIVDDWSPAARRGLSLAAHFAYGLGTGAALGVLRRERDDAATEAAVGSALGILSWGAGWSTLLPLAGVHEPPWNQDTPKVLLPVLDHAFFGAVWALSYRALRRGGTG